MRYVIVIVGITLLLMWDGFFNNGQYIDATVRGLSHLVKLVAG